MDALSDHWCAGWKSACVKIKEHLVEAAQKINDNESQKVIDELFQQVVKLESDAINEMPTLIMRK